jgi:hypothetical protein
VRLTRPRFEIVTENDMSQPSRSRIRRLPALLGALALALSVSGCLFDGPGGPMMTPTTGSIDATGSWPGYPGVFCIDNSTWTYTAVNLTGTEGETGPIVHTHQNLPQTLPVGGECRSRDTALFLRFGTWRVTWDGHSCVLDVKTQPWVVIGSNGNCQTHL